MSTIRRFILYAYFVALFITFNINIVYAEEWDHQSHAKPGGPYYHVDWDGDGSEIVTLDATESHSHYFHHGPPPESGRIVSYRWESGATGKLIHDTKSPYLRGTFFLGITILKLTVTDQTGDAATGWTYIQVRKPKAGENKVPVIRNISPATGPPAGGISVTIRGANFYNNPKITFSGIPVEFRVASETEIVAVSPRTSGTGNLHVDVTTGFGKSTKHVYKVATDIKAPVSFTYKVLQARQKSGAIGPFSVALITCIKLGPDGRYYAGSRDGFIHKWALSRALVVEQYCKGPQIGKARSVLGLAFHPHQWGTARAYITTGALYWKKNKSGGWANGDVEVWSSVASAQCMEFSHKVITGLPVSNHDHGANALEFTNEGNLLISVGGSTNAGVSFDGDKVGGIPESPLSSAILLAKLTNGVDFDGAIKYDQYNNPGTANVVSGDVTVFASGMRNVFGMTFHSNGNLYALDNGPNPVYGRSAAACGVAGPQIGFQDKLLRITNGAYYGHANWNRGRKDKRQCRFIRGDTKGLPINQYVPPMAVVPSSTNGIMEYTANTFEGQIRGDLFLSKLSWTQKGSLMKTRLSKNGHFVAQAPTPFLDNSGLSIVMGPFGEIVMPKYSAKSIGVYVPTDVSYEALRVISVTPRRGPMGGVNPVLITGNGFWEDVKIFFGNKECLSYKARTHESVWCQVPPAAPGSKVHVTARRDGLVSKTYGLNDYEYMMY